MALIPLAEDFYHSSDGADDSLHHELSIVTANFTIAITNVTVAASDNFVIKLAEMVECRIVGVKVMMPKQLKENESP